ncbi:protein-tyrosine phosphatase [Abditibacterium utsteinense]|uniref:protein-tyrosine-phosphatase n=1 Tax=Abditibacterium utsteinense TaxID=1960156 RepID=A0A2S8SVP2_9BACT|nr:CpsB/CapC family capsule biosynthesis tyrosine phosphatase [Abditibacterium utsteinense]PQV64865.1 protein-tyrosine phosphatase [Abditibacterium utsteinense]
MSSSSSAAPIGAPYDLHCHILPAWDDGAKTLDDSLQMLERAQKFGTTTIIATPHVGRAFRGVEHEASSIADGVEKLQTEVDARELKIKILPGAEILLGSVDLLGEAGVLPAWTVAGAGKYALIESPYRAWPEFGNSMVYQLKLRGVTPIIAHPERYLDVQKDIKRMENAISQGAILQITAGTILGQTDKAMQKCCFSLLDAGWAHLVASDAHNPGHAWPGETIEAVQKRVGEARARQIFEDNPRAVVEGSVFPVQVKPEKVESSSFMGRLFGGR